MPNKKSKIFSKVLLSIAALIIFYTGNFITSAAHAALIDPKSAVSANIIGVKNNKYVPGQIIIKMKEGVSPDNSLLNKYQLNSAEKISRADRMKKNEKAIQTINTHGLNRIYLAKFSEGKNMDSILTEIKKNPDVEFAEPNYLINIDSIPNDPYFPQLWGMNNTGQEFWTIGADIDAPEAWDLQTGSNNVVIAVIDTGVDYNHSDLAANIWTNPGEIPGNGIDDDLNGYIDDVRGWDFYNDDNDPMDDHFHGTHVAGTIGAVGNNATGVAGVNWNTKIMPLKFMGASGGGPISAAIAAIEYATIMKADIMNNSWGLDVDIPSLKIPIMAASDAGILFVAAAGNANYDTDIYPHYPASYDVSNIVAVAATDGNDNKASFSNYGPTTVDLGAPGVRIYSTLPNESYGYLAGTSMATPHVSGVAGLIKAKYPSLKAEGIKAKLLNHVDLLPSLQGKTVTGGRLNAYKSLTNDSPVANAGPDQSNIFIGSTLTFDGSGSYDPDGSITSYQWDFGDGNTASGIIVNHAYTTVGNYTATLVVTDNTGTTASDSANINIILPPPPTLYDISPVAPSYNAPADINLALEAHTNGSITKIEFFEGTNKIGEVTTPFDIQYGYPNIYTYSWTWNNVGIGNYTISAKATDNNGLTGTVTWPGTFNVIDAQNLMSHWKFDEASGTTASDSSGNGNTGTLVNGPVWTTGKVGNGLSFDGINDYVNVANSSSLNITGNKITLEAWVYPKSLTETYIVSKFGGDVVTSGYNLLITSSHIYFRLGNGTTRYQVNPTHGMSVNTWYHIVAVYDGAAMKVYKNGVALPGSTAFTGNIGSNSNNVNIGQRIDNLYRWNGVLDEVKIYDRPLSPSEITANYNAGLGI